MANRRVALMADRQRRFDHRYEHVEAPAGIKGGFRFSLIDGTWWWSPGMYELHGYRPEDATVVRPSTRVLVTHRHPDDRRAMAVAWAHLIADGSLAAFHYRIVGADGEIRPVFAMASTDFNRGHAPTMVTGVLQLEEFSTRTGLPASQPRMSSTAWP